MIGTIKTVDLIVFRNQTLTQVELEEYVLKLWFGEHRLDVEEYWEYLDSKEVLIDRSLSSKLRMEFKLPQLIGAKLVGVEHILESFYFKFDNKEVFKVSSPDFEFRSLKQHKAFGDGKAEVNSWYVKKGLEKELYGEDN